MPHAMELKLGLQPVTEAVRQFRYTGACARMHDGCSLSGAAVMRLRRYVRKTRRPQTLIVTRVWLYQYLVAQTTHALFFAGLLQPQWKRLQVCVGCSCCTRVSAEGGSSGNPGVLATSANHAAWPPRVQSPWGLPNPPAIISTCVHRGTARGYSRRKCAVSRARRTRLHVAVRRALTSGAGWAKKVGGVLVLECLLHPIPCAPRDVNCSFAGPSAALQELQLLP